MKSYFTIKFLDFFKLLAANNHKDWFDVNRAAYIENVKEPFAFFIEDLIAEASKIDTEINITAKDCIFRINRDVRFSKDKTAYKLQMAAIISKYGKKDNSYPGLYLELGPEKLGIYGGLFMPSTTEINKVRVAILNNLDMFNQLISNESFKNYFGELKGNKNKRIDKQFLEQSLLQALLLNKQWYFVATFPPEMIMSTDLMTIILDHFKAMQGLNNFFKMAIDK